MQCTIKGVAINALLLNRIFKRRNTGGVINIQTWLCLHRIFIMYAIDLNITYYRGGGKFMFWGVM